MPSKQDRLSPTAFRTDEEAGEGEQDGSELLNEFNNTTANAKNAAKTGKQPKAEKAAKPTKEPKPAKPTVNPLDKVIEAQANPTMWQYARIAKFVVQRTEAGQDRDAAYVAVMQQVQVIVNGILEQQPESSRDAHVDAATKRHFEQAHPKSLDRVRGPRAAQQDALKVTDGDVDEPDAVEDEEDEGDEDEDEDEQGDEAGEEGDEDETPE